MATVLLSSEPVSMIRRHKGIISVVRRKLITSDESFLTRAPMTPREVSRRYSKGLDLEVVFKNGYKNSGIWAEHVSGLLGVRRAKYIYHSKRVLGSHCVMPHIVEAQAHCRLGSMLQL
jgi:hypothetical protein